MTAVHQVTVGLEACLENPPEILRGARFGLLCNQASVDREFRMAPELLADRFPGQLAALFGPQHGLWSVQQDNMVETPHAVHPRLQVPVHSLYAETRTPSPMMLEGLDLLVVDLQDVGCRVYTYLWTLLACLRACAAAQVPVLVLDRPNPLGGVRAEGPCLEPGFESFVGAAPLPMRHGMTLAELALWLEHTVATGCDLHVLPMRDWRRTMLWPDTGRAWLPPSPNLPRWEGALVYPGMVLLEGTNVSEGRGTTTPFELCGAPWIDPHALAEAMAGLGLGGMTLRPVLFEPTHHKYTELQCGGLCLHVTDAGEFLPYRTAALLLAALRDSWPEQFAWKRPPYEYEKRLPPIDVITGSSRLRKAVDAGSGVVDAACALDEPEWWRHAGSFLLY